MPITDALLWWVKMWRSNREMHILLWKVRLHRPIEASPLSRWISLSRKHYPKVIFYIFRQQQHYWFCVPCSWNRILALLSVGKFNVWPMFLRDMKVWGSVWIGPWESCLGQAASPGVRFCSPAVGWTCLAQADSPGHQPNKPWLLCSLIQDQDSQYAYTEIMMITTIVWNAHLHKHRD